MVRTILLIALILAPQLSGACSGIRFTMRWTEPTTNEDGTPLTDLAKTTLYYQVNTNTPKKKDYIAKLLAGGGGNGWRQMPLGRRDSVNNAASRRYRSI